MPGLQGRAREDSNSSSNEEGVEELKTEASYEETQLDSRTFTQVITRTPASNSEQIDYEKIVNNKYNPLTVNSVSEGTPIVLTDPDNMEQDIDEFHKN